MISLVSRLLAVEGALPGRSTDEYDSIESIVSIESRMVSLVSRLLVVECALPGRSTDEYNSIVSRVNVISRIVSPVSRPACRGVCAPRAVNR